MKTKLFLILFFLPFTIQANLEKFPLYDIGIKFDKPETYFLMTSENVNALRKENFSIVSVCEASKKILELALSNPNYNVLINEKNYNETITFIKLPHYEVNQEISQFLKEKIKEQCYTLKNASLENLSDNVGTLPLGNYNSILYKVTTPEFSYYSEAFIIENRNSTILISINTINNPSNLSLIKSIENINSEAYDNIMEEFAKLAYLNKDFTNALLKLSEAIKLEPSNIMGYEKRILINGKLKNHNDVINDANKILNFDKKNVNAMVFKGTSNYFIGNCTEAIDNLQNAQLVISKLTIDNLQNEYCISFAEMYTCIGEGFICLKNPEKAIENLQAALELSYDSSNIASIYNTLGIVKSTLQNNPIEGIKFYSLAIYNYPTNRNKNKSEAFYNRGVNYGKIKKTDEEIKDYSSAIKLKPDYIKAYNNRSAAKISVEDYKGAIADCNQVLKLDNGQTEFTRLAFYNRGLAKISLDDTNGCDDIKKAKSLGQTISQEIMEICN
jgi:tetratricopeptide (TPR) repeat protein